MNLNEAREFAAETKEEAVEKARTHFGVPEERLELRFLPPSLGVSGVGSRVLLLASVREGPARELGPVGKFADGLVRRMRLEGRVDVEETEQEDGILIRMRGEALEQRVRQDDRLEAALSHLVHRVAQRTTEQSVAVRVGRGGGRPGSGRFAGGGGRAGTGGGRAGSGGEAPPESRALEELAHREASEVLRSGEPRLLRPMNSKERWIVHRVVTELEGVRSESVGEGRTRRVKIEPE